MSEYLPALLAMQTPHSDSSPFWAGEGMGLVVAGIFVVFAVYIVVQRLRAARKRKGMQR